MKWLGAHLTYANVMATVAVFVTLGGTSYAVTKLPARSVGKAQVRTAAITSRAIKDRSVRLRDVAPSTRKALIGSQGERGPAGPPGPTYRAAVDSIGGWVGGAGHSENLEADNTVDVWFDRPLSGCVPTATIAANDTNQPTPPPGRVTVAVRGDRIVVSTFGVNGEPQRLPFNVILAC